MPTLTLASTPSLPTAARSIVVFTNTKTIFNSDWDWIDRLTFFVVAEHAVLLLKYTLSSLIPDVAFPTRLQLERQTYLVGKHIYGRPERADPLEAADFDDPVAAAAAAADAATGLASPASVGVARGSSDGGGEGGAASAAGGRSSLVARGHARRISAAIPFILHESHAAMTGQAAQRGGDRAVVGGAAAGDTGAHKYKSSDGMGGPPGGTGSQV